MTATQSDPESDERTISRRGVMRATAIGLGATAAGGVGTKFAGSPVGDAAAFDWKAAGTYALAGPVGLIAYGATIAGPDEEEVADSLSWNTYVSEYTRAREDELLLDQTRASLERDVQLVANKAREQAIFGVYEQAIDSGTETTATTAAEDAINDAYATVERGIFDSWNLRAQRANAVTANLSDWRGDSNLTKNAMYVAFDDLGGVNGETINHETSDKTNFGNWTESSHDLVDGTTITYWGIDDLDNNVSFKLDLDPTTVAHRDNSDFGRADTLLLTKPDPADFSTVDEPLDVSYDEVILISQYHWYELLQDLYAEHSSVMSEVSSMVDSYFQPAQNGDLDLTQMLGPKYLTDTASTAKDYQEATMALRGMGYPISDQIVTISIPKENDDGRLELIGRLAWTAHQGNTLPVGSEIVPDNRVGSIFAAVNLSDGVDSVSENTTDGGSESDGPGAETIELTRPFIIQTADGADAVSFEDRTLARSDSSLSAEEVEQIFRENYEANKEAIETVHDTATSGGGGGGFLDGGGPSNRVLAIAAAGIGGLYLLGGE